MTLRVISLGAGVQSTTMALMAARGEIDLMPDCAIFADTQWEPPESLCSLGLARETTAISSASGDSRKFAASDHGPQQYDRRPICCGPMAYEDMPLWGVVSVLMSTSCARSSARLWSFLGGRPKYGAEVWIGISTDEAIRCKPSRVQYIVNTWPLLAQRMNRNDCLRWLERAGYPAAPKSSCIGCPFHSDSQWRALRENRQEWEDVIEVDTAIREQPGSRGKQYVHRSLVPLAEVDLSTAEDHGQLNLFNNECEGMCGV